MPLLLILLLYWELANKLIHVNAYLLLLDVVGSLPMVSIAVHAKGTFGISRCSWGWHAVLGRFLEKK